MTGTCRLDGTGAALPKVDAMSAAAELEAWDFVPLVYDKWEGGANVLAVARDIAADVVLPPDITCVRLGPATRAAQVAALAETALGCGVLPLHGAALRGDDLRSVCLVACDPRGRVAAFAASAAYAHPEHRGLAQQAWWGMLATDPARRGEKLALALGARALLAIHETHGFASFMTGVEPGNRPSEAVCARMGLAPQGNAILGCADPLVLRFGRMTK